MSGPKVVRIVTREELLEICQAELAKVDVALSYWESAVGSDTLLSAPDAESIRAKRHEIARLIEAGSFQEAQKQAPLAVASIRYDLDLRNERRRDHEIRRRRQERSLRFTAAALLKRCQSSSAQVPAETLRILDLVADGRHSQDAEAACQNAARLLASADISQKSDKSQALSQSLLEGESEPAWENQLHTYRRNAMGERFIELERGVAQLTVYNANSDASRFSDRLNAIVLEVDPQRCGLLSDSLAIELRLALKTAKEWTDFRQLVEETKAVAKATGDSSSVQDLINRMEERILRSDLGGAVTELDNLRERLEKLRRGRSAQAGRQAILTGLQSLGYEVREGMNTRWVKDKRLVVRHGSQRGVALEIGGDGENGRLQARAAAVAGEQRSSSGKEIEESWCSDFTRLKAHLAARGSAIDLEKSVAAGAQPIKEVTVFDDDDFEAAKTRSQVL